jgi:colicin import membrane protein
MERLERLESKEMNEPNNEMELIGTALTNFDRVSAGLALLEKNYKGVLYEVDTPMGMAHAKAARKAIRDPRYEVEKIRKDIKAPLLALGRRVDATAAQITNALLELENPIHEQIKFEEDRIEQEKIAIANAEAARLAQIQAFIEGFRQWPIQAAGKSSALVNQMLQTASDYEITEDVFQEHTATAKSVLMASLAALQGIYQERLNHEAEQARIIAERAELARLREESAERDRLAKEAQAKADAEAAEALRLERLAIAAEAAATAEKLRKEQEAAAEILRRQRAENDRIAAEQQAELDRQAEENRRIAREKAAEVERQAEVQRRENAAEAKRLAEQQAETERRNEEERARQADEAGRIAAARAALEAEQAAIAEAQRKASEPKPEPPKHRTVERPTAAQLIALVAEHYRVSPEMAEKWLRNIKWTNSEVAV